MSYISWNCRGTATARTATELRSLTYKYKPAILFLMETRAKLKRVERMRRKLHFQHLHCVEAEGIAGGLCLFWTDQYKVNIVDSCKNYIHTAIGNHQNDQSFNITWVYGNPTSIERRQLWPKIEKLQLNVHFPWMLCGDFNEMLESWEKQSHRPIDRVSSDCLRKFMDDVGLMDLELQGCKYTWIRNPREGLITKEKIDRVLANWEWRRMFPQATILALPIDSSDHAPLVINPNPQHRFGRRFKYEVRWDEHPQCQKIVADSWHKDPAHANEPWTSYLTRAADTTKQLTNWDRATFKNAARQIHALQQKLRGLINKPRSVFNSEEIQRVKVKLSELWKQEEQYWFQRSRVQWLKWGDRNTKFFHASTVQRRDRNTVLRIRIDSGEWQEGTYGVLASLEQNFGNLYQATETEHQQEVLNSVPELITQKENAKLVEEVTMNEVKAAVFSLGALKAPGPDGLNGQFFQKHWSTIKNDIFLAIRDFFCEWQSSAPSVPLEHH